MKTRPVDYQKLKNKSVETFNAALEKQDRRKMIESLAYLLGLDTGLRVSDLLDLKYSDIKYDVKIRKYLFTCIIKKKVRTNEKTGKKDYSKASHTNVISNEVNSYIDFYLKCLISLGFEPQDYIFWNYLHQKKYTRHWLSKQWGIFAKSLGFDENNGVHAIRKTAAIWVLDKSGSLSTTQFFLTHERATTTDLYLGISQQTAIQRMAKLFDVN